MSTRRQINWDRLLAEVLHPTQVAILAAVQWIEMPLSAALLTRVFDESVSLGSIAYHLKRLADLGALERVDQRQVRGATEWFWAPLRDGSTAESASAELNVGRG